jgi:hypothetical protein
MDRGRVGEDRGSKETDGCPLTVCGREDGFEETIILNGAVRRARTLLQVRSYCHHAQRRGAFCGFPHQTDTI